ncbi:MAG: PIN domain-containing protein [Gammaproteobacteria bacterium]|nr:PIN domain-containing protein [Gammaproteobacteria bacterium]
MEKIFVDTVYWIAAINPKDQWAGVARVAKSQLGRQPLLVTTDEVLAEVLAAFSGKGKQLGREEGMRLRRTTIAAVREIRSNSNIEVVPQSRDSFDQGLELYEDRADKDYSLTDCISMNTMKAHSIQKVLTSDHHFEQEEFTVLMKED